MTDSPERRVAVVISSTRPTRICPPIARSSRTALGEGSLLRYELVDLAEIDLPLLDEPLKAALQQAGDLGHLRHAGRQQGRRSASPGL